MIAGKAALSPTPQAPREAAGGQGSGQPNGAAEALRQAILPWLRARFPAATDVQLPLPGQPVGGGSSSTWFLAPFITGGGARRQLDLVLRIQATDYQIYRDPSVERQFKLLQYLHGAGDVPVPRPILYEGDAAVLGAPFFLMSRVAGGIPANNHHTSGLLAESPPARREIIWRSAIETLARIHRAPAGDLRFLAPGAASGLEQELGLWSGYMRWSGAPIRPVQQRAEAWLASNLPAHRPTGLAWGDARPGNMVFRDDACAAVLDWETASLAGGETDLAWWLLFDWMVSDAAGQPRLPGIPDAKTTIAAWEGFAGRRARDMEWHEVFAAWRYSLISDRARWLMKNASLPESPVPGRLETLLRR